MSISGFPEWLPEVRLIEEWVINTIKDVYISHGFYSIDHSSVELLSSLEENGIGGKEIFILKRAQSHDEEEAKLALHFDLTIPFARYVAENLSNLSFPLKRFSLQKVWRGERPQRGRYREFYQFDIDIVARETLPLACDAEVITVIEKAYRRLNLCDYEIRLNNRKILIGFYSNLGLSEENSHKAIGIVDKIDKIGVEGVHRELKLDLALTTNVIEQIIALSEFRSPADSIAQLSESMNCNNDIFLAGISELSEVIRLLPQTTKDKVVIDGSLARGLGYYTGTILEVRLPKYPEFGSAGGGGRYDNLTARFTTQNLPAVGASIGISRLIALIIEKNLITPSKKSSAQLLVTVLNEADRPASNAIADSFRNNGLPTEVFYKAPKLGKQIDYADQKGIRFVAFLEKEEGKIQLKDLANNVQEKFNSAEQASLWVKSCLAE